jgi:hypothetical protein
MHLDVLLFCDILYVVVAPLKLMLNEAEKIQRFQQAMIDYWDVHGRHDLPWRSTNDAWRILLGR